MNKTAGKPQVKAVRAQKPPKAKKQKSDKNNPNIEIIKEFKPKQIYSKIYKYDKEEFDKIGWHYFGKLDSPRADSIPVMLDNNRIAFIAGNGRKYYNPGFIGLPYALESEGLAAVEIIDLPQKNPDSALLYSKIYNYGGDIANPYISSSGYISYAVCSLNSAGDEFQIKVIGEYSNRTNLKINLKTGNLLYNHFRNEEKDSWFYQVTGSNYMKIRKDYSLLKINPFYETDDLIYAVTDSALFPNGAPDVLKNFLYLKEENKIVMIMRKKFQEFTIIPLRKENKDLKQYHVTHELIPSSDVKQMPEEGCILYDNFIKINKAIYKYSAKNQDFEKIYSIPEGFWCECGRFITPAHNSVIGAGKILFESENEYLLYDINESKEYRFSKDKTHPLYPAVIDTGGGKIMSAGGLKAVHSTKDGKPREIPREISDDIWIYTYK